MCLMKPDVTVGYSKAFDLIAEKTYRAKKIFVIIFGYVSLVLLLTINNKMSVSSFDIGTMNN